MFRAEAVKFLLLFLTQKLHVICSTSGVCTKPNAGKMQNISCTDDLQQCTYKCAPGYVNKTNTDAVKICQLDGSWSGPDLTCGMLIINCTILYAVTCMRVRL